MDVGSWTDVGSTGIKSDSSKPYNAIGKRMRLAVQVACN